MSKFTPITGSCGCGAVKYTITKPTDSPTACYCVTCQKFHSASFATYVRVDISSIVWHSRDTLKHKRGSDFASRTRCDECGSQVYIEYFMMPQTISMSAALFDQPVDLSKLKERCWVRSKFPWDAIPENDGVPTFQTERPEFEQAVQEWLAKKEPAKEIEW